MQEYIQQMPDGRTRIEREVEGGSVTVYFSEKDDGDTLERVKSMIMDAYAERKHREGINKGRVNKRDQPVKDLEINPDEAEWVREVFMKVAEEGASGYAMAQMLNQRGLRTRQGAEFQSSNIKRMIQHEGYTGYIITKAARSEFMPQLQIIDEALFAKANEMISKRSKKALKDKNAAQKSGNPTLLAGIVVCAHCGAKMSAFLHTDRYKLADGSIREKVQAKYNCYQRGQHLRECDGQSLYLAEKVDRIVLAYVDELFRKIKSEPYDKSIEQKIRQQEANHNRKKQAAEKKIKAAQYKQQRYEDEVLKCLEGESAFSQEMLARLITQAEAEVRQAKDEYAALLQNNDDRTTVQQIRSYYDEFLGWANEFNLATVERKRVILAQLFEKVEVGKDTRLQSMCEELISSSWEKNHMENFDYTISIGQLGEQLTLNQWVLGSSPRWCTKEKPYGNVGLSFFVQSSGKQCLVHNRGREQHVRAVSVPPGSNSPVDCWKVRGSLRSLISWQGDCCPGLLHQRQPYTVCRAVFLLLHPEGLRPSRCRRGREQHIRAVSVPPGSNSPVDCWKVRGSLRSLIGRKGGCCPVPPYQKSAPCRKAGRFSCVLCLCLWEVCTRCRRGGERPQR